MHWVLDKEKKTLCLCGTYKFELNEPLNTVESNQCDYILPQDKLKLFDYLTFNIFGGYKFLVNKEFFDKLNTAWYPFPFTFTEIYDSKEVEENKGKNPATYTYYGSSSTNEDVRFLEGLFKALGYNTLTTQLDYGKEESLMKDGYTPMFYYGGGRGCCLFVKKI
jgi:hypothetical protein